MMWWMRVVRPWMARWVIEEQNSTGPRFTAGGINESRSGSEDRVGVSRIALFGVSLSLDDVCAARPCVVNDVQHLCHAWRVLASRDPQSTGESQPDRLYSMVELRSCRRYGHAGIAEYGFQHGTGGCRNP